MEPSCVASPRVDHDLCEPRANMAKLAHPARAASARESTSSRAGAVALPGAANERDREAQRRRAVARYGECGRRRGAPHRGATRSRGSLRRQSGEPSVAGGGREPPELAAIQVAAPAQNRLRKGQVRREAAPRTTTRRCGGRSDWVGRCAEQRLRRRDFDDAGRIELRAPAGASGIRGPVGLSTRGGWSRRTEAASGRAGGGRRQRVSLHRCRTPSRPSARARPPRRRPVARRPARPPRREPRQPGPPPARPCPARGRSRRGGSRTPPGPLPP